MSQTGVFQALALILWPWKIRERGGKIKSSTIEAAVQECIIF